MRTIAFFLTGLALVAGLSACGTSGPTQPSATCPFTGFTSEGEALPNCSFKGMPGWPPLQTSSLKGTPLMLNFWASWCSACIKEMPAIDSIATAFTGRLAVVGMNELGVEGESEVDATHFAKQTGIHYRLAYDTKGALYAHFQSRPTLPITVFADAGGVVRGIYIGEMDTGLLRSNLQKFLHLR